MAPSIVSRIYVRPDGLHNNKMSVVHLAAW